MKIASVALSTLLITALAGCAGSADDIAGPPATYTLQPVTPVQLVGAPGERVQEQSLPQVRVVSSKSGPVAGAVVSFTTSINGRLSGYQVATDRNGIARLDSWVLGPTTGEYDITASAAGAEPLLFAAFARTRIVAVYDLSEPVEGFAVGSLHYYLFDDGTYIRSEVTSSPGLRDVPKGRYDVVDPMTIQFLGGPQSSGGIYALGGAGGGGLHLLYPDRRQYEGETYTRRPSDPNSGDSYLIQSINAVKLVVAPGSDILPQDLPTVRTLYPEKLLAPGITVTFTRTGSGGTSTYSVQSDGNANARLDSWQVGSATGEYSVRASVPGGESVLFTALAR